MNKTKTITLGEPFIRDLLKSLKDYIKLLNSNIDQNREEIRNLQNFLSLIESVPWNEGGYSIDDFT